AVVPAGMPAKARLVARKGGRVAGLGPALGTFELLSGSFRFEIPAPDGRDVDADATLAWVEGPARELLSAERTALNLLGHLSGIATVTRGVVAAVAGSRARVVCTRKTTPLLRALEKYAVRVGGGANHRFGLDDAVLIKDNHRAIAGSIAEAVRRVRGHVGHLVKVELEVDTLAAVAEALEAGVEAILLDNMTPQELKEAVRLVGGRAITEASGGITPSTAAEVAATGVDLLSIGWLTHSAPNLDVALDVEL
ncbi:MAG TPA: carboxylating nicotinate-nucleotide diphosphorylase, partial [Thermoanaerobaculia bacterium]|nr:carboxylating nicotinate-nucleotide diphosphorylase [Thermoanaerobaculia bacterium]